MHHLADFFQPIVKLRAKTDQPGNPEQLGNGIQVAVHSLGHAGVLHLQNQLEPVAAAPGAMDLAQRGGADGLRIHVQPGKPLWVQFSLQHPLNRRPFQ